MKVKNCPKCDKKGSLQETWVLNGAGKRYEPYYSIVHYDSETRKKRRCYVSRDVAHELMGTSPNTSGILEAPEAVYSDEDMPP